MVEQQVLGLAELALWEREQRVVEQQVLGPLELGQLGLALRELEQPGEPCHQAQRLLL